MGYDYEIFYITEEGNTILNVYTKGEETVSYSGDCKRYFRNTDKIYYFDNQDKIKEISMLLNRDINKDHDIFQKIYFDQIKQDFNSINSTNTEHENKIDTIKKIINSFTSVKELMEYLKNLEIDDSDYTVPYYYDDLKEIYKNCLKYKTKYIIIGYTP